ncbi:MAG: hypothetical protein KKF67_03710 [Nanoarchaeota archaeon]|nr:hypothetical protein [Nanoarchaeota archaeon]
MPKKKVKRKRRSSVVRRRKSESRNFTVKKDKFKQTLKNLIFFGILSLLFLGFSSYAEEEFYYNMFLLISMIFGAISLSFLVVLVVLFFVKIMKKK